MYVYVTSSDSVNIYEKNNPLDFTVDFDQPFDLKGDWTVSLVELFGIKSTSYCIFDVCSDIVDVNSVQRSQILRRIYLERGVVKQDFKHLLYVDVNRSRIARLRIYIKVCEGEISSLDKTHATLHFKQHGDSTIQV